MYKNLAPNKRGCKVLRTENIGFEKCLVICFIVGDCGGVDTYVASHFRKVSIEVGADILGVFQEFVGRVLLPTA